jgi:hypothetical protein
MPSYDLNWKDPQTALRILICLVEQNKGQIELWAEDYDSLDKAKVLTYSYNRQKGKITLNVSSDNGGAVVVQPEAHAWTQPAESAPLERARAEATRQARRVAVPSDAELADMEEELKKRQNLAKLEEEGKAPLRIRTQN